MVVCSTTRLDEASDQRFELAIGNPLDLGLSVLHRQQTGYKKYQIENCSCLLIAQLHSFIFLGQWDANYKPSPG
jgi:hypothetical protein